MSPGRGAAWLLLGCAGAGGAVLGIGSALFAPERRAATVAMTADVAVAAGVARRRTPQPGDHWGGCNDARATGTAPIYRGEPGCRSDMDGDGDGVACEPPR